MNGGCGPTLTAGARALESKKRTLPHEGVRSAASPQQNPGNVQPDNLGLRIRAQIRERLGAAWVLPDTSTNQKRARPTTSAPSRAIPAADISRLGQVRRAVAPSTSTY